MSDLNQQFATLNDRIGKLYHFVILYGDYMNSKHDYGTGHQLTMIEAHILTFIDDNPGTTVTELSKYWNRTKGAISKTVSRLVERGFVTRYQKEDNAKTILLKVTEEGLKLSQAHKLYDTIDIAKTLDDLLKKCTIEDIDSFYKVIDTYIELIKKDFK